MRRKTVHGEARINRIVLPKVRAGREAGDLEQPLACCMSTDRMALSRRVGKWFQKHYTSAYACSTKRPRGDNLLHWLSDWADNSGAHRRSKQLRLYPIHAKSLVLVSQRRRVLFLLAICKIKAGSNTGRKMGAAGARRVARRSRKRGAIGCSDGRGTRGVPTAPRRDD